MSYGLTLYCLFSFWRLLYQSEFGVLVFLTEFFIIFLPIAIYPLFYYSEIYNLNESGRNFVASNGAPYLAEAFHVFLYALAACIGYFVFSKKTSFGNKFINLLKVKFNPEKMFLKLILFGLVAFYLFYFMVCVDNVFLHAKAARAGFVENYGDAQKYLFLKTLAKVATYSVCFLPWFLQGERSMKYKLIFAMYVVFLMLNYISSYGRGMWLGSLIIPFWFIIDIKLVSVFLSKLFLCFFCHMLFLYMVKILGKR